MSTWRRFLLFWPFRRSRPLVDEIVQVPVLRPGRELKVEEPRVPVAVEAGERVAEAAPPPRSAVPDAQICQHLWESLRLRTAIWLDRNLVLLIIRANLPCGTR